MGRVSGKVVLITGGARGMGASHARRLIAEGAKVMITDMLDEEGAATAAALGDHARFLHHDVRSESQWQNIVRDTEAAFGPVSVLVNNAGILGVGNVETLEEADYRRVIDINQVAVFLGMKSVLPSMKRAGGGSIINISSVAGLVGIAGSLSYVASKFAVSGMTKAAAIELAPYNIRVNSIHPGLIRTPMTDPTQETEAILTAAAAEIPACRVGEPDEVSSIILLLASDESRYSTGAAFVVDGGFSCK
jgi:3alpha(or 20beta)-hydroxysteroid dehydrogenase